MYTCAGAMASYKSDINTRVGYISKHISTEPSFQMQRFQKTHQQIASQQQRQEKVVEMAPLSPKGVFETFKEEIVMEKKPARQKPSTFNVYISCLDREEKLVTKIKSEKPEIETEMKDHFKDDLSVFNGVFGNVIINNDGLVLYTDISGGRHCEDYECDDIEKIFPMGISHGGLSKSIWFKDVEARDNCFDLMAKLEPSSSQTVQANPTNVEMVEEDDNDNMVVFEGINSRNVIVHAENLVLYTDIKGDKHCIHYEKREINKCFPNGIQDGGLSKSIWFKDEMERDLCFSLMQWNMDEEDEEEIIEKSLNLNYTGLYGSVVLNNDSQIEFTSLSGDRVKCFYEPSKITESFPKGISYGMLPKNIWFQSVEERDRCIDAMRKI